MSFWDKASKIGASVGKAVVEEGKQKGSYFIKVNKMNNAELLAEYGKGLSLGEKRIVEAKLKSQGLL